jgi:hypothetical protein
MRPSIKAWQEPISRAYSDRRSALTLLGTCHYRLASFNPHRTNSAWPSTWRKTDVLQQRTEQGCKTCVTRRASFWETPSSGCLAWCVAKSSCNLSAHASDSVSHAASAKMSSEGLMKKTRDPSARCCHRRSRCACRTRPRLPDASREAGGRATVPLPRRSCSL